MQQILIEDVPVLYLAYSPVIWAHRDNIGGVQAHAALAHWAYRRVVGEVTARVAFSIQGVEWRLHPHPFPGTNRMYGMEGDFFHPHPFPHQGGRDNMTYTNAT